MSRLSKTAIHFREQDCLTQVWGEMFLPDTSAQFRKLRHSPKRFVWYMLISVTASFSKPNTFPLHLQSGESKHRGMKPVPFSLTHTANPRAFCLEFPWVSKQLDLYPSQEAALRETSGSSLYLVCCSSHIYFLKKSLLGWAGGKTGSRSFWLLKEDHPVALSNKSYIFPTKKNNS